MKQLLIVNSQKALNAGTSVTPYDLSGLDEGAITFFELGASSLLSAAATKNFAIALGRGANKPAFVIPEVDIDTLEIVKAAPEAGKKYKGVFTFPTPEVGKEYTIILVKKGTLAHERNLFSTSIIAKTTTAATEAGKLVDAINAKVNELFPVTASNSGAAVTIDGDDYTDWELKFADGLADVTITAASSNQAKEPIGDKAFIQKLAQQCAAGKGFNLLDGDSKDIYPGYPEAIEDLVPNASGTGGASTAGYALFSLHFATGRKSGKQVDERVWQYVHIAVPITNSSYSDIATILPEGKFSVNATNAAASAAVAAAAASSGD